MTNPKSWLKYPFSLSRLQAQSNIKINCKILIKICPFFAVYEKSKNLSREDSSWEKVCRFGRNKI